MTKLSAVLLFSALCAATAFSGCAKSGGNSGNTGAAVYNPCDLNPGAPTCTGACFADPYQVGCSGWGICGADPYAYGCAGYCVVNPEDSSCGGLGDSVGQGTKDTSLQQAQLESASLQDRARNISNQFGMSYDAAVRLTALADRMNQLSSANQLSDDDRAAITDAALAVAGITADDENAAATRMIQTGDSSAIDDLLVKAAANLGMSSPAALRDQILPALGIVLPTAANSN